MANRLKNIALYEWLLIIVIVGLLVAMLIPVFGF
jgi:hypothetical protein